MGQGEDTTHRYDQNGENNDTVQGRAYQPPQRRPMDLACYHLDTIRQENTTRDASQSAERRPGQILGRHDMAEDRTQDRVIWRRYFWRKEIFICQSIHTIMVFTKQWFQPGRPSLRPPCGRFRDRGIRPSTGHNGCLMMMIMMMIF